MTDLEKERLKRTLAYNILDTVPEEEYDNLVRVAAYMCDAPYALMSLVDEDRVWFKARHGILASEASRDSSFCTHVVDEPVDAFIVEDASIDPRFDSNPYVHGEPHIKHYIGVPLLTPSEHYKIGALCVMHHEARKPDVEQIEHLKRLARCIMIHLDLKVAFADLVDRERVLEDYRRSVKRQLLQSIQTDVGSIERNVELDQGNS
jgi:GAF domain-containing protein